jgi:hypothetical protein
MEKPRSAGRRIAPGTIVHTPLGNPDRVNVGRAPGPGFLEFRYLDSPKLQRARELAVARHIRARNASARNAARVVANRQDDSRTAADIARERRQGSPY